MKFFTALKKPRTVNQLASLLGCTTGNVRAYLRRYKSKVKTAGEGRKTKGDPGPAPVLYVLRKKTTARRPARLTVAEINAALFEQASLPGKLDVLNALNDAGMISPENAKAVLSEQGVPETTTQETTALAQATVGAGHAA